MKEYFMVNINTNKSPGIFHITLIKFNKRPN
jgi:hypothetical protein